jgi:hypothetical protein
MASSSVRDATLDACHSEEAARRPTKSDFRTPVESIGLQKPENLLLAVKEKTKADSSCRLQQGLQVEIGTSLRSE